VSAELLLRGAFLDGRAALDAWNTWYAGTGLDAAGPECVGLLPLLHRKLEALGADHPALKRLKGVRRRIWLENQIALRDAARVLAKLEAAGIETLVLGGLALSTGYYRDAGLRSIRPIEILVRERAHADPIALRGSEPNVVLRRRLLYLGCPRRIADDWWQASTPVRVGEASSRALCPADQLLHTLINGVRRRKVPFALWMADALVILADGRVDCARAAGQAGELRIKLFVRRALERLSTALDCAVAPELLERLKGPRESRMDRLEYEYFTHLRADRPLPSWPVGLYRRYRRSRS